MTRLSENRPSTGGRRNRRRLVALATLLAAAVSGSASARADDRHRSELRDQVTIDMPVDVPVTGAALAVWLGSELFKGDLAPSACRWCSADALDTGVRNRLRWAGGAAAAITASNVAAYAVAPAVGVGLVALAAAHDDRIGELWIDALLMTQAVALAGDVTQLVKFTAGRQRPFAHAGLPNPDTSQAPADNNLSFYSGHTSFTFSLAAAGGAIATLRRYRWAPAVWIVGGLVGATTGYLRIAADQHYFTDVLTGAVVGTGVGLAVPYTLHRRAVRPSSASALDSDSARPSILLAPVNGGASLLCTGSW